MSEINKETLSARTTQLVQRYIDEAIERRRQAIVYTLARKMHRRFATADLQTEASEKEWQLVSSLSQLRTMVGGRFQNLKERWLAAGFPLRAHRGDREELGEIRHEGWIELAAWVDKQGYDTRLAEEDENALFCIRKR